MCSHISWRYLKQLFKYVLSTMGVSKESISKFLIGNRFHVKLRILSPYEITDIYLPFARQLFHIALVNLLGYDSGS